MGSVNIARKLNLVISFVYPVSKTLETAYFIADIVSFSPLSKSSPWHFYTSLNSPISFVKLHSFFHVKFIYCNFSMLPWISYFVLLFLHCGHSSRLFLTVRFWFINSAVLHIGCRTFFDKVSMNQSCMPNTKPTQFHLILPVTFYGVTPFFETEVWYYINYRFLTSIKLQVYIIK